MENIELARAFRDTGIQKVTFNNQHFLSVAREIAKSLCKKNGFTTMDSVRRNCPLEPLHPNAWGAVFKPKEFVFTGEFRQSKQVSRKGGYQRVWRHEPA